MWKRRQKEEKSKEQLAPNFEVLNSENCKVICHEYGQETVGSYYKLEWHIEIGFSNFIIQQRR